MAAFIQIMHCFCHTRSWYNTCYHNCLCKSLWPCEVWCLTGKLLRKTVSVLGGGSLSGLTLIRSILSILYLRHTEFLSHTTTLLYFCPHCFERITCLSCHLCSHSFLILFWLSWILTALNHLSARVHKCVIVLSCTVCSVISSNSWSFLPLPFLLCFICFPPLWIHLPLSWCYHQILACSLFVLTSFSLLLFLSSWYPLCRGSDRNTTAQGRIDNTG